MNLVERVVTGIEERRQRIIDNKVNCIPSPFPSFSESFPGIEQGKYYIVTAATKGAKSQLGSYLFLYTPILFAYANRDKVRVHIFYLNLEETQEKILLRFISYLLFTEYKIRISPLKLWSVIQGQIFDNTVLDIIKSKEMQDKLYFFKDSITFIEERNPTGTWKKVREYAESNGTIHKKWDDRLKKEVFDYYEPNDPDAYNIIFADHAGRVEQERGFTKKETIDKLSDYFVRFRDNFKYTPVLIQQQNSDTVSLEASKYNNIRPSYNGLMDTKVTGQDASLILGLTCPYSFNKALFPYPDNPSSTKNYNIRKLKGYARFLEVVMNREGESNNMLPLYFDGAVNYFVPLPKADDFTELNKVYQLVERNSE